MQFRFWYFMQDPKPEGCCPFSASSGAQLSPGYTALGSTLGCRAAEWVQLLLSSPMTIRQPEMNQDNHNAGIALSFTQFDPLSATTSSASGAHHWEVQLGLAHSCVGAWNYHSMPKADPWCIKHHWILSGDGNRNCSHVPC